MLNYIVMKIPLDFPEKEENLQDYSLILDHLSSKI